MTKGKRIVAFLLVLVLMVSMVPALQTEANAYTTPRTLTARELRDKIDTLCNLLEGKYFTTTGYSCGNNACDACKNVNVFEATWFKNMFGTVTGSQIPTHAYPYGVTGTAIGWTCHGFANFAQWYLFATSNNDKVTNYRVVDNVTMTRANMLKYAKPGDIIRYTYNTAYGYGHSVIFLQANETTYTVLDNNFAWNGDAKSRVRTHTISYNSGIPMAISRANNYPTSDSIDPALNIQFNANGGTVDDTYKIKTDTPDNILNLRSGTSTSHSILTTIPHGTVLQVMDTVTSGVNTWGNVTYNGITGWCCLTGLTVREGCYMEGDVIYQQATSKPYTQSWYYGEGGGLVSPSTLTLSKEGFKFLGWSTSPDGTDTIYDPANTSLKAEDICPEVKDTDQNITLYAIWEDATPTTMTFHFDGHGAAGYMAPIIASRGDSLAVPANQFTIAGDEFKGWYLEREDGMWFTDLGWDATMEPKLLPDQPHFTLDNSFIGITGNHSYTFHAQWKNDGMTGITINTQPTKVNYALNSQFDPTGLTLTVHYSDGSSNVISEGFTTGQPTFTQVGTTTVEVVYQGFTAWVTVNVYEPPTVAAGTATGYLDEVVKLPIQYIGNAQCSGLSLMLSFDSTQVSCMGYSLPEGIDSSNVKVSLGEQGKVGIVYTGTLTTDTALVLVHLKIKGNAASIPVSIEDALCQDTNGGSYAPDTKNGTLTNRGLITLRYDVGSGSNTPSAVQLRYGQQVMVSSIIPTRAGYTFLGWSPFSGSTTANYQSGDVIACMTDMVLYAVWKKNPTVAAPTLTLSYPTVSFEDQIQYNVYYTVSDMSNIAEMGLITFNSKLANGTVADAVDVISGYTGNGSNYMVHTHGIAAKNWGDALYFKVYARLTNGSYVYSSVAGYNAVAYAKSVLSNASASKQAKSLVVAMLNYGAASQVQFSYKTNELMNAFLTDAGKALVSDYNSSMMSPVVAADAARAGHFVMNKTAFTSAYPTVSFEGAFSINYYFTAGLTPDSRITFCYWDAKTYASADKLTTSNATGMMQMVADGNRWYAAVEGIAAKDMDQTVYVAAIYKSGGKTYTTSVIAYSLGKYCQNMADSGNALGAAAAVYGYYAKAYFA